MEENQQLPEKKKNTTGMLLIVFLLVLAGIGVWAFANQNTSEQPTQATSVEQPQSTQQSESSPPVVAGDETNTATPDDTANDVQVISVEAGSFYFKPNEIRVNRGQKVKITMTSKDMMHDFTIDALGVKLPVTNSGETKTVEFTVDKAGTYEFYCSVGQHRQNGQVGKLIVE